MAANPADFLHDRAACDEATASLNLELRDYKHEDDNQEFDAETDATQAASIARRLAKAITDVERHTADLARPDNDDAEKRRLQRALIAATALRDRLQIASTAHTGAPAYLAAVKGDQTDGQVAVLTAAIAGVLAHRDTLSK